MQANVLGRFCIMIAGVTPRRDGLATLNSNLIMPSLHLIGDRDPIKPARAFLWPVSLLLRPSCGPTACLHT